MWNNDNSCLWIILILLLVCCCCGNGFGMGRNGCDCQNDSCC